MTLSAILVIDVFIAPAEWFMYARSRRYTQGVSFSHAKPNHKLRRPSKVPDDSSSNVANGVDRNGLPDFGNWNLNFANRTKLKEFLGCVNLLHNQRRNHTTWDDVFCGALEWDCEIGYLVVDSTTTVKTLLGYFSIRWVLCYLRLRCALSAEKLEISLPEWGTRDWVPGALKLEHLHPFKPILFLQFSNCLIFILGGQFLLAHRATKRVREFLQLQMWMRQRGFSAWGIQTGPNAAL